jgi:predicted phage terminase large subunit-like protein
LFRQKRHVLIVSETESQSVDFLNDIKLELTENNDLIELFEVSKLVKDAATDIICKFKDGTKFRIRAIGAEQRVRGRKWSGTRPDLVICDDIEGDEQVESDSRREKFRNWFFKALVPSLSDHGHIRVVGTILHLDSLLSRLLTNKSWKHKFYKAHKSFDDFTELLWPEKWPEDRLRAERDEKSAAGMPEAYSQEYLNNPIDQAEAFFRREDFLEMEHKDYESRKSYYAAVDFAISDSDRADYTVIAVGGMDEFSNLHITYVLRFRGDANEIIENMFAIQRRFNIDMWKAEEGAIKKTLWGELQRRMLEQNVVLNIVPGMPTKDKRTRARPIQARMRAGGVKFDKRGSWYPILEEEFMHFPKGAHKDQVDALAWLGICINELNDAPTKLEFEQDEYDEMKREFESESFLGRSAITGY